MTYEEFQRHVGKAGLNLTEFAKLVRMKRGSLSNLSKRDEVPSHLAVIACLMGEMAEHGVAFRPALEKLEITPKKARGGSSPGRFGGTRQSDLFAAERRAGDQRPLPATIEQTKNIMGGTDMQERAR